MSIRYGSAWLSSLLVMIAVAGCGRSTVVEYATVGGRRVQGTTMDAGARLPYRVAAYELEFAPGTTSGRQARRAALLTDLTGGHGHARGFVEWGRPGEEPLIYVVGGWARQRSTAGELQTVFDLTLAHLDARGAPGALADPPHPEPVAVRVVVHEVSGAVTLTRRR
jgi:hypothetical protein